MAETRRGRCPLLVGIAALAVLWVVLLSSATPRPAQTRPPHAVDSLDAANDSLPGHRRRRLAAQVDAASVESSSGSSGVVVLLGILSTLTDTGKERRENDPPDLPVPPPRVLDARIHPQPAGASPLHPRLRLCRGRQPHGPPEHVDDAVPLTADRDAVVLDPEQDVEYLNIRENLVDGKVNTWFKHVAYTDNFGIDYVAKLDDDTVVYTHRLLRFVDDNLWPAPRNTRVYGGHPSRLLGLRRRQERLLPTGERTVLHGGTVLLYEQRSRQIRVLRGGPRGRPTVGHRRPRHGRLRLVQPPTPSKPSTSHHGSSGTTPSENPANSNDAGRSSKPTQPTTTPSIQWNDTQRDAREKERKKERKRRERNWTRIRNTLTRRENSMNLMSNIYMSFRKLSTRNSPWFCSRSF